MAFADRIFVGQRYTIYKNYGISITGNLFEIGNGYIRLDRLAGHPRDVRTLIFDGEISKIVHLKADGTSDVVWTRPARGGRHHKSRKTRKARWSRRRSFRV